VDQFSQGVDRLDLKLEKWKTDLSHSDLTSKLHLGVQKAPVPNNELGDDDEADDGQENLEVDVIQTRGHCEFADGELHMVGDEAENRDEGSEATDI
jgi:hypothetical protein